MNVAWKCKRKKIICHNARLFEGILITTVFFLKTVCYTVAVHKQMRRMHMFNVKL